MASARRVLLRRWVPYVVLASSLALTAALTLYVMRTARAADELRFQTVAEETRSLVQVRLDSYVELLRAGAALFVASREVTPQEFRSFAGGLQVRQRYPGMQGIGLALYVTRPLPGTWPAGERPAYTPIVALEPADERNTAALGFDMYTDPTRRAAMERARDTGQPAASGRVTLVQEIEGTPQAGVLVYMPVYRGGAVPATVADRRRALHGFVYSPFRADDLFASIVGARQDMALRVYDGVGEEAAQLLHTSPLPPETTPHEPLRTAAQIAVAGRPWTLAFDAHQHFGGSSPWLVPSVLIGGLLLSFALFGIMRTQISAWESAARHAAELRASEEAQREAGERLRRLVALEREARADAQLADRAKDEFLATLSHELRTPLNAMLGWISMLRSGKMREERRAEAMAVIERNARTQARLIEDLLDVSRIITGKVRLELQPVQVAPVVQNAIEGMRPTAESKGVRLHTDIVHDAPRLMADPGRIQQVVWNLISNAIKFTPPGGDVFVVLAPDGAALRLSVRDTGIGIEADFLPHVFERFRQADSSTTRAHSGVGLGLAIVRHIVELHGGSIEAHSDGRDRGAVFVVRLPIAADANLMHNAERTLTHSTR